VCEITTRLHSDWDPDEGVCVRLRYKKHLRIQMVKIGPAL
jgi:hypothetical protein